MPAKILLTEFGFLVDAAADMIFALPAKKLLTEFGFVVDAAVDTRFLNHHLYHEGHEVYV